VSSPVLYSAGPAFAGLPGAFELVHRLNGLRASLSKEAAILLDQILGGTTAEKERGSGKVRFQDITIMKKTDASSSTLFL
jgi:hypothetical protein